MNKTAIAQSSIACFMGPNRRFSNFHLKPIFWRGLWFPSTESAYQYTKGIGVEDPEKLIRFHSPLVLANGEVFPVYTPSEVKREGRKIKCREDWARIKYTVMLLVNIEKYSTNPERQDLLNTGMVELREGNWWHDNEWGDCIFGSRNDALLYMSGKPFQPCLKCINIKGQNLLGEIVMRNRTDIQHDEKHKQIAG